MNRYKQREDSSPLAGAAYIRFSSEMQSDSFSLDAQLRQIKEKAERDDVEIVKVFADPAQSAYRKKYCSEIAAISMSGLSLLVAINALLLKRHRLEGIKDN